jgi:hypothetical protein
MIVAEFNETKSAEEMEFVSFPIWMRAERLPFGMMNRATAQVIGDDIGKFMEADVDSDEMAIGRALRIKVRLDVRKPLRRGILADLGDDKGECWCLISYERLPEFCYTCGIVGHVDQACHMKLGKEEKALFSSELRYIQQCKPYVPKHQAVGGGQSGGSGGSGSWRSSRSDSRSDGPSWRKSVEDARVVGRKESSDQEVTSPLKKKSQEASAAGGDGDDVLEKASGVRGVLFLEGEADGSAGGREMMVNPVVNSDMQSAHVELADGAKGSDSKGSEMRKRAGKFKKVQRPGGWW